MTASALPERRTSLRSAAGDPIRSRDGRDPVVPAVLFKGMLTRKSASVLVSQARLHHRSRRLQR